MEEKYYYHHNIKQWGKYLLFLFQFCRSNTAPLQYIHIHYINQDTNFKRIFTDHFSAGLAVYANGIFGEKPTKTKLLLTFACLIYIML